MATKPKLALISGGSAGIPAPPRVLGEAGLSLWQRIMAEYAITDAGGVELLWQACAGADRAAECAAAIKAEGVTIRTKTGIRDHPLLRHEAAARAFVVRTLQRLGLDVEPLRPTPGRPAGPRI